VGENSNRVPRTVPYQGERQFAGAQAAQPGVQGKQSMVTLLILKQIGKASTFEERIHHQGVRHEMAHVGVEECGMSLMDEEVDCTSAAVEPEIEGLEKAHSPAIRSCSGYSFEVDPWKRNVGAQDVVRRDDEMQADAAAGRSEMSSAGGFVVGAEKLAV
jgi:hypothetical protein